jgi:NAD(P)-dependent dehydrogenase (short-subunit alcohol dehydrogenase family)
VDLLTETAKTAPANSVRVVTTASLAESDAPPEGVNLQDQFLEGNVGTGGMTLYGQSKLGNIIISQDWAKRYGSRGIIFSSLVSTFPYSVTMLYYIVLYAEMKHPGVLKTELQRDFNFAMRSMTLVSFLFRRSSDYPVWSTIASSA